MTATEDVMGRAAEAAIPRLSEAEAQLLELPPVAPREISEEARVMHECWAYQHLDYARRARVTMDRLAWGPEYVHLHRVREAALECAAQHMAVLRDANIPPDTLLMEMAAAEELAP